MSAWSEAVWIVKKLDARFDFQTTIANYTAQLNELNGRVNNVIDNYNTFETQLANSACTIVSNSVPSGTFYTGTIWLKTV